MDENECKGMTCPIEPDMAAELERKNAEQAAMESKPVTIDEDKLTPEQKEVLEKFKKETAIKVPHEKIKDWYDRASKVTMETFPDFMKEITETEQDYRSVADAMTCLALAAVHAFNDTPNGKLMSPAHPHVIGTRFYANVMGIHSPFRILDYESILDPACDGDFFTMPKQIYAWLRTRAKDLFETETEAPSALRKRWKQVMNGKLPDGWIVREEKPLS